MPEPKNDQWFKINIDGWANFEVKSTFNFSRNKVKKDKVPKILAKQIKLAFEKANCLVIEIVPSRFHENEEE